MRITDPVSFGAAIKKRRKELGYTQKELADYCGCSTVFLSQLENGKETAELGRALTIIATLGIDLTAFKRTGGEL